MQRIIMLACLVACLISQHTIAQNPKAMKGVINKGYNFWLYTPDSIETNVKKPLIVFLHGKSLSGNDLNRVLRYGPLKAIRRHGLNIDAFIVAPQTSNGWNPSKVMDVVNWAKGNCNIDTTRIYAIGMSMGGYGTTDFCNAYPDKIAAGMEICGGCSYKDVSGLSKMPFWILHGTADRAVGISVANNLVEKIKQNGDERLLYTKLKGYNHGQPERIFNIDATYNWLFSHSLNDADRPVNKDYYDEITADKLNKSIANRKYIR